MAIYNNKNTYLIDSTGQYTRVDRVWSNDTVMNARVELNAGTQDGLLPDTDKRYPYIEAEFRFPSTSNFDRNGESFGGWNFELLIENIQQTYSPERIIKPDAYCKVRITDPLGKTRIAVIDPTIEKIALQYKNFIMLVTTTSFDSSKQELKLATIERGLTDLQKEFTELKQLLSQ